MSSKVEMSLDDIIKKDRKSGQQNRGKQGVSKKTIARKGKFGKKVGGNKQQRNAGGSKPVNNAATKRLVQKLVKKALAQSGAARPNNGGNQGRVVRKANKPFRGVSRRSKLIQKAPKTETVVVRRIVQHRPKPRPQIVREVIVQEPVRQQIYAPLPARRFNNNRPKIVYVEKHGPPQRSSFGGGGFGGRRNFVRQQRRRITDPFYEPTNYLQRF